MPCLYIDSKIEMSSLFSLFWPSKYYSLKSQVMCYDPMSFYSLSPFILCLIPYPFVWCTFIVSLESFHLYLKDSIKSLKSPFALVLSLSDSSCSTLKQRSSWDFPLLLSWVRATILCISFLLSSFKPSRNFLWGRNALAIIFGALLLFHPHTDW